MISALALAAEEEERVELAVLERREALVRARRARRSPLTRGPPPRPVDAAPSASTYSSERQVEDVDAALPPELALERPSASGRPPRSGSRACSSPQMRCRKTRRFQSRARSRGRGSGCGAASPRARPARGSSVGLREVVDVVVLADDVALPLAPRPRSTPPWILRTTVRSSSESSLYSFGTSISAALPSGRVQELPAVAGRARGTRRGRAPRRRRGTPAPARRRSCRDDQLAAAAPRSRSTAASREPGGAGPARVALEDRVQLVVERPDAVRERDVLGDPRQVARCSGGHSNERARCAASSRGATGSASRPAPATVLPTTSTSRPRSRAATDVGELVLAPRPVRAGSSSASWRRIDR